MKKLPLFLAFSLLLGVLFETNPNHKGRYAKYVAAELQSICCSRASPGAPAAPCQRLRPITEPLVHGVVYLYTDSPTNYIFFTKYTTRLPARTVYGIGVAGQFVVWPKREKESWGCEILISLLPSTLSE